MNIEVKNLTLSYLKRKRVLDNISFSLKSPGFIGLLGPNGAGKSSLMRILTASLIQNSGEVLIDGKKLLKNENYLKSSLGYLPQYFGFYDQLTVYEFLDYMASLKNIKNRKQAVDKVIKMTNLDEKKKFKISNLSGGQRQRVGIAQSFLGNPKLIILDEPTVGLDPEERINFRNIFSKSADDRVVLLSTHIIEDVHSVCEKLIVINKGKILFNGTEDEMLAIADGHVCELSSMPDEKDSDRYRITSRSRKDNKLLLRAVTVDKVSDDKKIYPTLEDAYIYIILSDEVMK